MRFNEVIDDSLVPKIQPYDWMKDKTFTLVQDMDHLKEIIDKAIEKNLCALDLETEGLDSRIDKVGKTVHKIVGYCLSYDGEEGFYVPVGHFEVNTKREKQGLSPYNLNRLEVAEEIKRLCENCVTIYHNAAFDHEFLYGSEAKIEIDKPSMFEDTLILDYLRDSTDKRHGLKHLSNRFLEMEMIDLKQLFLSEVKDRDFSTLDPSNRNTILYAGSDAICTYLLFEFYKTHNHHGDPESDPKKTIYGEQKSVYTIEKALVPALRWMERNRPKVDVDYIKRLEQEVDSMMKDCELAIKKALVEGITDKSGKPIYTMKNFRHDVTSPQQLGEALLELKKHNSAFSNVDLKLTEKSNQVRTNNEAVEELYEQYGSRFPFLKKIITFRGLQKVHGTYIKPILENSDWRGNDYHNNRQSLNDNTIRFSFLPHRVDTGRFAASKGRPEHGFSGINVQSAPGCYTSAKLPVKKIHERPEGPGAAKSPIIQEYLEAAESRDFMKKVYDRHFIQDNRTGDEYCIRATCEGCPFLEDCDHDEPIKKKFYSVENAVRPALVAREGYVIVGIDYAGLELRAAANISKEPKWIDEFNNGDGDLHKLTAQLVYGDDVVNLAPSSFKLKRQNAKGANFSIIYGGGGGAIARATGVDTKEGWEIRNKILKGLSRFGKWMKETIRKAHKEKEVSTTIGRKIRLHDINSEEDWLRAKQERNAINSIVQGTATGDLIKYAMGSVYRELKSRGWEKDICRMMLTIHDELVFEIRQDMLDEVLPIVNECMIEFADKVNWPVGLETDIEFNTDWSPRHDWGKIHTIDPETHLAEARTPSYLVGKIEFEEGMWYLDDNREKKVWDGHEFINEKAYLKDKIDDFEESKESMSEEDAEKTPENPEFSESELEPKETSEVSETKNEVQPEPDIPVYKHRISVPINSKDMVASYSLRVRRIKDIFKILTKLKKIKPTHLLEIEDVQGNKVVSASDGVLIDPEVFEYFSLYEGI